MQSDSQGKGLMPFIEINDFSGPESNTHRREASDLMTGALAASFGIERDIVSIYFQSFGPKSYAHAGQLPAAPEKRRIFVKIHALRGGLDDRRHAAQLVTEAAVTAYGIEPKAVAVYFLERETDEIAHAGRIFADLPC